MVHSTDIHAALILLFVGGIATYWDGLWLAGRPPRNTDIFRFARLMVHIVVLASVGLISRRSLVVQEWGVLSLDVRCDTRKNILIAASRQRGLARAEIWERVLLAVTLTSRSTATNSTGFRWKIYSCNLRANMSGPPRVSAMSSIRARIPLDKHSPQQGIQRQCYDQSRARNTYFSAIRSIYVFRRIYASRRHLAPRCPLGTDISLL